MDASLLDTDTLSEFLKRRNAAVTARAKAYLKQHGQFTFSEFTMPSRCSGSRVPEPGTDHHKAYAAATTEASLGLLSFLAVGQSIASPEQAIEAVRQLAMLAAT